MTDGKHTPGPWKVEDYTDDPDSACFMVVPPDYYGTVAKVQSQADARLIVAAPDLLAVVREACAIFDMNREGEEYNGDLASDLWKNEIHEKLTAAIAKAGAA